jgi:hypothetical protein
MHGYKLRESPIVLGPASTLWNGKWPSSRMQMQTQAKLPLHLHRYELPLNYSAVLNGLFLQLVQFICDG